MQEEPLFVNEQLNVNNLPSLNDVSFLKLAPALWKHAIATTLLTFSFLIVPVLITWISSSYWWVSLIATAIWVLLLIMSLILTRYQYQIKGYVLRMHDIVYRRGLLFRHITTIPFNRIQHCEIQEGPLERLFKLNTLLIYTAGGSSSDLAIPGLLPDQAKRLRDFILKKVSKEEEEGNLELERSPNQEIEEVRRSEDEESE